MTMHQIGASSSKTSQGLYPLSHSPVPVHHKGDGQVSRMMSCGYGPPRDHLPGIRQPPAARHTQHSYTPKVMKFTPLMLPQVD